MRVNHTIIYLIENISENKNVIYVGKTDNIVVRASGHRKKFGNQINITTIDTIQSKRRQDWEPIEIMWIQTFLSWGFLLPNKILGYRGSAYLNRFVL